jgi:hypothetical protein
MTDDPLVGRRIRLIAMPDDPAPIPPGTTGTITMVSRLPAFTQLHVKWDINRSLMLSVPPDRYELLAEKPA